MNPGQRTAPEGSGANATTKTYRQPEAYTAGASAFDIPAHSLHPAEADLRFVANTTHRERPHWWIAMIRRHQAECSRCRRCDGSVAA